MEQHGRRKRDKPRCVTYSTWSAIKTRCYNENSKDFIKYGGRGIVMCDRWKDSFLAFVEDMGERPSKAYRIDRYPDLDGDYEPGNCRWATLSEQNINRRTPKNNTSGIKGINRAKKGNGKWVYWEVRVQRDGKRHCLGTFKTIKEAVKAKEEFIKELD